VGGVGFHPPGTDHPVQLNPPELNPAAPALPPGGGRPFSPGGHSLVICRFCAECLFRSLIRYSVDAHASSQDPPAVVLPAGSVVGMYQQRDAPTVLSEWRPPPTCTARLANRAVRPGYDAWARLMLAHGPVRRRRPLGAPRLGTPRRSARRGSASVCSDGSFEWRRCSRRVPRIRHRCRPSAGICRRRLPFTAFGTNRRTCPADLSPCLHFIPNRDGALSSPTSGR